MKKPKISQVVIDLLEDANRRAVKASVSDVNAQQLETLDKIAAKASDVFQCPISQITLLDNKVQTFLLSRGIDVKQAPTETSFCAYTLATENPVFVIFDAADDSRFVDNPFVKGGVKIRFYVGCPIVLNDQRIGTVCLYDFEPRKEIAREQISLLIDLTWDAATVLKSKKQSD